LLVAYLLVGLSSVVFASYYTGQLVLQHRTANVVLIGAAGALLLGILLLIPVLNILVFVAMVLGGVGMIVMHLRYQFSKQPYRVMAKKHAR